ncbi:MAG: outer membrane lipoprotein-sorting protein [Chitinivibrionales bacterium]|nr:outer membrane lipoprotein-sorting protein [Chitinivibrionales bacterium]
MIRNLMLVALIAAAPSFALTGEEILEKMDQNRNHTTISYKGIMEIHIDDEVRTKQMSAKAMAGKKEKAIVTFLNPADEGTKYLMIDDKLWIYFPEEEDVVKISGHMLKEGMMGSDVSYEDALESDKLSDKYDIQRVGEETIDGYDCYVIKLDAKVKDVPYFKRKMWVTKSNFVQIKEEMYAKSGKLLKTSRTLEIKKIGDRDFPVKVEMVNKLRKNSKTIFTMRNIEFDKPMNESTFSMRYLRR